MKKIFASLALATAFAVTIPLAHASMITYNDTYTGTGIYDNTVTAQGKGTVTYTFTPGSTVGVLTGFTETVTLSSTKFPGGTSVYTYTGLADVASDSVSVNSTTGALASINVASIGLTGTDTALGLVAFNLQFSGPINDSTLDSKGTGVFIEADTNGGGSMTLAPPAAAPEPSSLVLLGTGLSGLAALIRKRLSA